MDLQEIGLGRGACSGLTWLRIGTLAFVNMLVSFHVPEFS